MPRCKHGEHTHAIFASMLCTNVQPLDHKRGNTFSTLENYYRIYDRVLVGTPAGSFGLFWPGPDGPDHTPTKSIIHCPAAAISGRRENTTTIRHSLVDVFCNPTERQSSTH